MRKLLLTSAGFENKRLEKWFLKLAEKPPQNIRALFIPTAAIFPDAIAVLPKCLNDLLYAGVLPENISVFDLHRNMPYEELSAFDAVYVCGGDTKYLLNRINNTRFCEPLRQFAENGGVYVGASAGSLVVAGNLPDNLGFVKATLSVHQQAGTKPGAVSATEAGHYDLTDRQALLLHGETCEIVE